MTHIPRALRELRINDRPTGNGAEMIMGWEDAQRFWSSQPIEQPDIILCDINFDRDSTSPLHNVSPYKPTGLLYALPFLALARANSIPVVLKFHTGDPTLFSRLHNKAEVETHKKPPHLMSYLAGELVGLVVAMLEDFGAGIPINLDGAWEWLGDRNNTFENETGALFAAKEAYRRRLGILCRSRDAQGPGLVVDPDGYQRLVEWCEGLKGKNDVSEEDCNKDPGVVLLRSDGSRDCIAIRSLFHADNRFQPQRFAIQGADHGEEPPEDAWLSRNEARVGEFVHFLGDWPRLFRLAADGLKPFPCDGTESSQTIVKAIPNTQAGYKMIKLLALFFQAIRLHWHARNLWKKQYEDTEWNPKEMSFGRACEENTLTSYLKRAYAVLCSFSEGAPIPASEIMKGLANRGWGGLEEEDGENEKLYEWIHFHVEMLLSMGLIKRNSEGYYITSSTSFPAELPACPPSRLLKNR